MPANIVSGMPESQYHMVKALSAGGAFTLAAECPALYWAESPFNDAALPADNAKEMDIGTALHLAVLEPDRFGERAIVVDAENWRTKDAKEARDRAYDAGLTPLLVKDRELVDRLAAALRGNEFVAELLDGADTEVSYFWDCDGVPAKARADVVAKDCRRLADLKASANASPTFFQRQAYNAGHFLRSPWYSDGYEAVTGKRVEYWYVIASRKPPHLVTVAKLDERAEAWGRMMIRRALTLFRECRERGVWPPYCTGPTTLSIPTWAEYALADAEQEGRFSEAEIRASMALVAP